MTTDAWRAVSELAASQHGCFSTLQAAASDVPLTTLQSWRRHGRIESLHRGVHRVVGATRTWRSLLMAATLIGDGRTVVVSHRAAAVLHGIDGVEGDWLEVTLPRSHRLVIAGFVVHRTVLLRPADVVRVDGIRTTTMARTVCDLGAVVDDDTVLRCADDVARRRSVRWLEQTLQRTARPGPSGSGAARRALADDDVGKVGSWFERLVARPLRAAGLPVVAQYRLLGPDGRLVARFDLALPDVRLGIEADTNRWHYGTRRNRRDAARDARASALDWDVLYMGRDDADVHGAVVEKVRAVADIRRLRIAPPVTGR